MIKVLEKNKLATAALQKWFTARMKKAVEENKITAHLKTSFTDVVISVEKLAPIITINPRSLFDFFDEYEIYILPILIGGMFSATINGEPLDGTERGKVYTLRVSAEVLAVIEAFEILEKNLDTDER